MIEIEIYDSARRCRRPFEPLDGRNVRLYVCGPTVYDRAHIGNARSAVVFDLLFRFLRHVYGAQHVTYVRNITDIDDKIIARALSEASDDARPLNDIVHDITERTVDWYRDDMAALATLPPTHEPRATQFVPEMIAMITTLIKGGNAYEAAGHVLFNVQSHAEYGALSNRTLEQMKAGARVETAPYKRHPSDFVLWKPSDDEQPGWDSPWGRGRPGWHIECSAMSAHLLGTSFDIHGGGADLLFPHHENEVAQSRCAHPDGEFARYWMHNGFLRVEGDKMAKSAGNFTTVRDLLDGGTDGTAIRLALLMTHYRRPLDWTAERLREASGILAEWRAIAEGSSGGSVCRDVADALRDDLNTPAALAALHGMAARGQGADLRQSAELLGLPLDKPALAAQPDAADLQIIEQLMACRDEARRRGDFALSDGIRDRLAKAGIAISDGRDGASWMMKGQFDRQALANGEEVPS